MNKDIMFPKVYGVYLLSQSTSRALFTHLIKHILSKIDKDRGKYNNSAKHKG